MFEFTAGVVIRAPIGLLYDFHRNPHNLCYILPRGQRIVELQMPGRVEAGADLRLKLRQYGLTWKWRVTWEELTPPHGSPAQARLVDQARESPFSFWRHTHDFQEVEDGVKMTDQVEYDLPFKPWDRLIQPLVRSQLASFFAQRHRKTKILMEQLKLEQDMRELGLPIPEL